MPSEVTAYRRRRGKGFSALYRGSADTPSVVGSSITTLASDTFTRADNGSSLGVADSGQTWAAQIGTWGIATNRGVPPNVLGAATLDAGQAVITIQLTCIPGGASQTDVGVLARYVDSSNYVFLNVSKSGANLQTRTFKRIGGSNTGITTLQTAVTGDTTSPVVMKIVFASATAGESFVNGVSMGTFTGLDAAVQSATKHGIWINNSSNACRFDDLTVTVP